MAPRDIGMFPNLVPASPVDQDNSFYFVDERKADGSAPGRAVSGPGHADHFFELHVKPEQGPWLQTFVPGKGYVKFN
jgi:hypothetical protein